MRNTIKRHGFKDNNSIIVDVRPDVTNAELCAIAPSLAQECAYHDRSEHFIPFKTIEIVEALRKEGFVPFQVAENKVRKEDKKTFQRHMVRFKFAKPLMLTNGVEAQIALFNANDGTSALKALAAWFRMWCRNGGYAVDKEIESISVRHAGRDKTMENVINAFYQFGSAVPQIADIVQRQSSLQLTESERIAFARAALELRWQSEEREENGEIIRVQNAPIKPERLLQVRRNADMSQDLFTTMNVVQEHLIRGGDEGLNRSNGLMTTRAVNSITENTRINSALWVLTREMEKLKTGN